MSNTKLAISPIRSFTSRTAPHYPSRRTLRLSDTDGGNDNDNNDSVNNITEAITHLESLVTQIAELAQDVEAGDGASSPASPGKRRPSDGIIARGWRYLSSQEALAKDRGPENSRPQKVTFRINQDSESSDHKVGDGSGAAGQTPSQNHDKHPISKAAVTAPETSVTIVSEDDSPHKITRLAGAEDFMRKVYLRNDPIPPPRRAPPVRPDPPHSNGMGLLEELKHSPTVSSDEVAAPSPDSEKHFTQMFGVRQNTSAVHYNRSQTSGSHVVDLKKVNHVDLLNKPNNFNVHHSCGHASQARNWPDSRKRIAATVVCINTACLGLIIGIYSGEVPAIQYMIADFHHYAILGNVFLYSGLAISTFLLWPLPLLHGRKVYTVAGLSLAFGLQIPQGIVVTQYRMPDNV